jgi:DNA-binding NtrC family response regulator
MELHSPIINRPDIGPPAGEILIVDDEPALLRLMSAYLGRLGHSVSTMSSTAKAWAALETPPAGLRVVVLDASMQGVSMEDLALRALQADPSMCVIAASGYPVDMSALEAAAPRRVMFLQKPFTGDMLASAVRRLLAAQEEAV